MTIQDLDPEALDLLIDILEEQNSSPVTSTQSQKVHYAVSGLIVILEDELVGEMAA